MIPTDAHAALRARLTVEVVASVVRLGRQKHVERDGHFMGGLDAARDYLVETLRPELTARESFQDVIVRLTAERDRLVAERVDWLNRFTEGEERWDAQTARADRLERERANAFEDGYQVGVQAGEAVAAALQVELDAAEAQVEALTAERDALIARHHNP